MSSGLLNRTIAAMRALRMSDLKSPAEVRQLASELGVDGVIVGSITAWDPYDPPKLGIALARAHKARLIGLCAADSPMPFAGPDMAGAMADAWRAEVVAMWPQLAYDEVLEERLLDALLACIWLSTHLFLPEDHARIASVREHGLSVPRIPALRARWSLLAEFATATGHDDVAAHARDVLAHLEDRAAG